MGSHDAHRCATARAAADQAAAIAGAVRELWGGKLELFGSAARGEFDPGHSDLDFIVQMKGRREPGYARRFCDFADALEALYGRPVDLLTELMIKNPYFKAEVQKDRTIVVDL
jgi:predicted nucleotidyltransferase